jgi:hypothetical protein
MLMTNMNSNANWAYTAIAKRTQQLVTSGVNHYRLYWSSITFEFSEDTFLCIVRVIRCSMHNNPGLNLEHSTSDTDSDMLHVRLRSSVVHGNNVTLDQKRGLLAVFSAAVLQPRHRKIPRHSASSAHIALVTSLGSVYQVRDRCEPIHCSAVSSVGMDFVHPLTLQFFTLLGCKWLCYFGVFRYIHLKAHSGFAVARYSS